MPLPATKHVGTVCICQIHTTVLHYVTQQLTEQSEVICALLCTLDLAKYLGSEASFPRTLLLHCPKRLSYYYGLNSTADSWVRFDLYTLCQFCNSLAFLFLEDALLLCNFHNGLPFTLAIFGSRHKQVDVDFQSVSCKGEKKVRPSCKKCAI